jgi:DNA invertase Pin-like site-specific DNA recombinase
MATKAIAYLRTSSTTNVGGDSDKRQRSAIQAYAMASGIDVVDEYYDAAVSGADAVQDRPGFSAMLDRIEGNGVRTILVEDASRFARDLLVQEAGLAMLVSRGVKVLTASGDDMTATDDPMRKMLRQIVGAVMEAEKARLVAKLKAARDRKSAEVGYTIGNTRYAKDGTLAVLAELRRDNPDMSQDRLGEVMAERGIFNSAGKRLSQVQVGRLLRQMATAD